MPNFRYKAMTASGAVVTGVLEARSAEAVVRQLRSQGHFPIATTDAAAKGWRAWIEGVLLMRRRGSPRDLAIGTHELAMLLHAGLPLDRALEILAAMEETKRLRAPLRGVLARVRDGMSLADALAFDRSFPRLYVSVVRAGELGGSLEATLRRLAEYLNKAAAIRDAIGSALIYPTILLATAGLSISVILVFVLPKFEPLFESAGKTLPLGTRIVMASGHLLGGYWWAMVLFAAVAGVSFRQALRAHEFRRRFDTLVLRMPLVRGLLVKMEMERFSRTLGTLLGNGVPLPTALGITKDTLANVVVAAAVAGAAVRLREGEGLAAELSRTRVFPAIALDLIRVGEETGRLDEMLLRQAELCEHGIRHAIDRLLALLVPVLTIVLGALVAGIIASLVSAILSVNDLALR